MARYILSGIIQDQQENPVGEKPVVVQMFFAPMAGETGIISGQELWFTTDEDGNIPADFYLVPGTYRIEWRLGAVRNVNYFVMPSEDADIKDILVDDITERDLMIRNTKRFDTVQEMLDSDATQWTTAECRNFNPGDRILTNWKTTSDPTILPNGQNVLQTAQPPITVYRTFLLEPDDGTVVPGNGLESYHASTPVSVPTIQDLKDSVFDAPRVTIDSTATPYTFVRSDLAPDFDPDLPDTDENKVTNKIGTIYVRWLGI